MWDETRPFLQLVSQSRWPEGQAGVGEPARLSLLAPAVSLPQGVAPGKLVSPSAISTPIRGS